MIFKTTTTLALSIAVLAGFSASSFAQGDIEAGKALSMSCSACHGVEGISPLPIYPNLAGQHAQYLEKQLKDFRDGNRQNPMMAPMAANLSDEDIAHLASYYESLK